MICCRYYAQIFNPVYLYRQVARQVGGHPDLNMLLDVIAIEEDIDEDEDMAALPMRSLYYRYKRNVIVLEQVRDTFLCQWFRDGYMEQRLDMLADEDSVQAIFDAAGDELTVIDLGNGREIRPDYASVKAYVMCVLKVKQKMEAHRRWIRQYKRQFRDLQRECTAFHSIDKVDSYATAMELLADNMTAAENLFSRQLGADRRRLEEYFAYPAEFESSVRLFGLYVYVINYGLAHCRFLNSTGRTRAVAYNRVLSRLRQLMAEDEGMMDRYIDHMGMTQNERENLLFMLDEEELIGNGSDFVGENLFG